MKNPKPQKQVVIASAEDMRLAGFIKQAKTEKRKGVTVSSRTVGPMVKNLIKKLKK